jgi:hypothetical protein
VREKTSAVVEDFQEVAAFGAGQHGPSSVVEDENLDATEALQEATVSSVAAREGQRFEETRDAVIEDRMVVAAGLVGKRAGDPALSEASRVIRRFS